MTDARVHLLRAMRATVDALSTAFSLAEFAPAAKFSDDQPRDEAGRWTDGGGGGDGSGDNGGSSRDYDKVVIAGDITPVNPVTNTDKVDMLAQSMREDGWQGNPILVYGDGDNFQALTGSHRIYAAMETGTDVPISIIDISDFTEDDYQTLSDIDEDEDRLSFLQTLHERGLVDDNQISIMTDEVNANYANTDRNYAREANQYRENRAREFADKPDVPNPHVNERGKYHLDNYLGSMREKYGDDIYSAMSDDEINTLDKLEKETYKKSIKIIAYYDRASAAKQRDRREPASERKDEFERKLAAIIKRRFRKQAELIRQRLEFIAPDRKATPTIPLTDFDDVFADDQELTADLIRLLNNAARDGIALFGQRSPLQIDWSLVNDRAARWARDYVYDLVKDIDKTTQDVLKNAISTFADTPGFRIGDVVDLLPFGEERALMVATTEITRAYAEANQQAGEALKDEFPDVRVIKTWFTNNDDLVCEICGPLDGKEVGLDDEFDTDISNPPAHPRCRCWTETSTALAEL